VVSFAVVSVVGLFLLIAVQGWLPWSLGRSMDWDTAVNTAVSFVTNTNWQSYAGEAGAGYTVQAVGLTVQNFVSAATGLAVAVALVRGIARHSTDRIGNFWVDLVRGTIRILLPMAVVAAILLLVGGVIQNLTDPTTITTVTGGQQVVQGGAVASQEAIKELGTNGGGFFNANSAHPFENPNAWTNLFEIFLLLVIPFSLPYAYGLMVGSRRQGAVATATMGGLLVTSMGLAAWAEYSAAGSALGSMEGKEQRFGIPWSSVFAGATTGTSTGAVNSMHDSFSALGGAVPLSNMMLGEVSPGGVGTGLYNLLIYVVLAVFIAGLMVGRTPELLGKTVGRKEITYVALSVVVTPALVLIGTGLAIVLPAATAGLLNTGPHGLSEMLYAYTSASNNNGSAFAGLTADQPFLNLTLALCMFAGRFVPIVLVLALAGAFAAQRRRPVTAGTMPTDTPLFTVLLAGTVVVVAGLTFFPALALGPIAEALS
jgi:K+-transporting ATPase ATPase A chain